MAIKIDRITDYTDPRIPEALDACGMDSNFITARFFVSENNILLIASEKNTVYGFLYAYLLQRIEKLNPMLFLYSIDVFPEHRKKGIASSLIEKLKEIGEERRICKMFVLTDEENIPAMKLYASTGGHRREPDQVLFEYSGD